MHIPLTVRYIPDQAGRDGAWRGDPFPRWQQSESRPEIPVRAGVPLRRSEVTDPAGLRLLDDQGRPVPAQFDTEATWSDGSLQWVLVSFVANGSGEKGQSFTLTTDDSLQAATVDPPVKVANDPNTCRLDTGPMRVRINKRAMCGLSQVWLDIDGDGVFSNEELISTESPVGGILAVDAQDRIYTSGAGRVRRVRIERSGPIHAVICVEGDLRSQKDTGPLLEYAMRLHAFAGSSLVRVVLTVRNPRTAGRAEDGSRFVLGQAGSALFRSLGFVVPVRLTEGCKQVTLSSEPGRMFDRIPLTGPMSAYQDSSGGED